MNDLIPWWSPRENPSITIGREFFTTALKDYEDWRIKWFREAIQNAVDAGSTKVDILSKNLPDGTWVVSVQDNGGGMSEDVLVNKFLVLGGTTKVGAAGTAGGFGKAKELLVLPWLSWRIHTGGVEAAGSGIDYQITHKPRINGTIIEVTMPGDNYTYYAPAISFIEKCYLPKVHFTVNGSPYKAALKAGKLVESVEGKVDIYFNKGKVDTSQLLVRTNGLFMFNMYLGSGIPGYVIAEITAPSIEILTANRDGFRDYTVRRAVSEFAERIVKDVKSATRSKKGLIRQKFAGTGKFRAESVEEILEQVGPLPEPSTRDGVEISDGTLERVASVIDDFRREVPESDAMVGAVTKPTAIALMQGTRIHGALDMEAVVKQLVWKPDFILINEEEGFRIPKKFFPGTMTPTVLKLAKTWTELCRFVLIQLGSNMSFGVGFIFDENTAAAYQPDAGEHWLLLNPFKKMSSKEDLWAPTHVPDLKWLYASAIHECTHLADGLEYHDEGFASALTHNMAKCADGFKRIRQIVGTIRMHGSPEAQ